MYEVEDQVQIRRRQADKAVALAMENRWEEAVQVNRAILDLFPNDADSYNRLGKAFTELSKFTDAKRSYKKALELEPSNRIARKNLDRLTVLSKAGGVEAETTRVDPTLFIEEMGKSTTTLLQETSPPTLSRLNAGDRLELRERGSAMAVETPAGDLVGFIEPRLSARLKKLVEGGNEYAAAVTSLAPDSCRVIIKESYQHPSQAGKPSFPASMSAEATRPYTKESLLRYAESPDDVLEDDEVEAGGDSDAEAWDGETEAQEGDVRLYDAAAAEDVEDEIEE
jgi:hypothetical protein